MQLKYPKGLIKYIHLYHHVHFLQGSRGKGTYEVASPPAFPSPHEVGERDRVRGKSLSETMMRFIFSFLLYVSASGFAEAAAKTYASTIPVKSFDGFVLQTMVDLPDDVSEENVKRVVVLLHGSGPQNMDSDFSAISAPGTVNRWFVDISGGLTEAGFAVVRYNKRSYESAQRLKAGPAFKRSKIFKAYAANPLGYFVDDAKHFVRWARGRFPGAKVHLLGHSQGAYIALQVARQMKSVAGLALVGFTIQSLDTALYEQTVYRPLGDFVRLDMNRDGRLDSREVDGNGKLETAIRRQLGILDLDGNGSVERVEFIAGNLSNLILDTTSMDEIRMQEARYPRVGEIIRDLRIPIVFFQGELDNQCRSFNTKAIDIMNRAVWRKKNLHFQYFPRFGHALDPRTGAHDLVYRQIDPEALAAVASTLNTFWE